jgi:hypothetical protein
MFTIKDLRERFGELYYGHRKKWAYDKNGHDNHAVNFNVYHKGYEDAQNEVGRILLELAEELAVPTFTGMDSITLSEKRKGYNEGQKAAAKAIKKLVLEDKERTRK